ncbi:E3 ubiquitin-protein ligase TRIM39-like [Cyprinodon tularosa]|uniref:E3 ubiquitin-protein ligase TRIM39-like n=1 Tax=Cyprinodon tularosa TaxID=77115 RepID=UPI0018E26E48|nr:E3 ubiquitin-protein ligase TRIM39-like [Cyprinodon tularosa]XP_038158844.1 E3 ubiquitin-protein ligase TRIM39-like [Cyprinodon tularosa]
MSLPTAFLSEDQFTCSICLEIFTNPVSTPCGHSFCQSCLTSYWNSGGRGRGAKTYQCPMCKDSFNKRPELHINRTLKEITEHFKQMTGGGEHPSLAGQHPAMSPPVRPGEMPEVLLAEMVARFQGLTSPGTPHQRFPQPLQASQTQDSHDPPPPYSPPLSYSGGSFSDFPSNMPLCPVHLRGLDMFCRTDNVCVCSVCAETGEHRGHSVIPAQREWNIKKSQLGIHEVELKELISERERKVEEIHKSVREMKAAAELETDGVVCALTKLISTVEHCQSKILETIETAVQIAESRAQSLLTELEEEIAALRKRSSTLSQLAASEDYVHFFKTFPAVSTPPQAKDWSNVSLPSQTTSEGILRTVNQTVECLQLEIQKLPQLCQQSSSASPVPRPSLKVRRVQEYAEEITLDPSTAHPRLIISPDGKQVQCGDRYQLVLDHPQRFDRVVCVMAHQGFTSGRHYWEVDVGNKTDWDLGVASRSVIRKGKISVSPAHGYWFLSLRDQTDYAFRTDPSTPLTVTVRPSRVGIYIDYDKGLLSFYNVEAKLLIYSFTDSFPDTIHPFFSPCTNKSGRNGAPLVICPVSMTQ